MNRSTSSFLAIMPIMITNSSAATINLCLKLVGETTLHTRLTLRKTNKKLKQPGPGPKDPSVFLARFSKRQSFLG